MFTLSYDNVKYNYRGDNMYYFLDIDGVLNRKSDWSKRYYINPGCLCAFKKLLSYDSSPTIILSSTWRTGISKSGNNDGLLEIIESTGICIADVTPYASGKTRLEEINYYVKRHKIDKFVAIDDDESLFPNAGDFPLYLVDYKVGFTETDAKKIRRKYL